MMSHAEARPGVREIEWTEAALEDGCVRLNAGSRGALLSSFGAFLPAALERVGGW